MQIIYRVTCFKNFPSPKEYLTLYFFNHLIAETDNIIIISSSILFGKKCGKISNLIPTRKQGKSDPKAFSESGSETRMLGILLLWTPSLKYCRKLKGEYKNSKCGSGTSVGPSLSPHSLNLRTIFVTLSL